MRLFTHFYNFIANFFHKRHLKLFSPFRSITNRLTYPVLRQSSCLSPILFNIYFSQVFKNVRSPNISIIAYADDLLIYTSNKDLDIGKVHLTSALSFLDRTLNHLFFTLDLQKSKFIVFTRRRVDEPNNISLQGI